MGDFLSSRMPMFKALEEELGGDVRGPACSQDSGLLPSTSSHMLMEEIRREGLGIIRFQGTMAQRWVSTGDTWAVLALLLHGPWSPVL